jgi:hypothetical protein
MTASAAATRTAPTTKDKTLKDKNGKHKFLVIEVSQSDDRRYPRTLFGCATLEEALKLCKQMNTDAGFQKFAVRGESSEKK